ncbi:MAG: NAD(+) diphosphatase [Eubacterium sp.]|jgi:NAD+ diphosphatase|nr:NAD(+) diphosphatase [Eubacterium sp.]
MLQDIFPKILDNQYVNKPLTQNSAIISFCGDNVLFGSQEERFPLYSEIKLINGEAGYLFESGGTDYFLVDCKNISESVGYAYKNIKIFRDAMPKHLAFAGVTALHLYRWYNDSKYCGRCGSVLSRDIKERMMHCKNCQNSVYPRISPVVIVAVSDGDKLLLTKYSGGKYKNYALIAGFVEIGESAEQAVKREVMEEVGVRVKNIRYYKSQPWGFSESLLLGYFAELDGDPEITIDNNELSEALWIKGEKIPAEPEDFSLTNEMMCEFKRRGNGERQK